MSFAIKNTEQSGVNTRILRGVDLEISNPKGKVMVSKILRKRRQSTTEKEEYLNAHNAARSRVSPTAGNMKKMKWSNELAQVAQNYAKKCIWKHNPSRTSETKTLTSQFTYVGENLYATSASSADPSSAVESWNSEKTEYDYSTSICSGVCGHYTQVAWASSEYVGCGSSTCLAFTGLSSSFNGGTIVVCNYGEGGNYAGQPPYMSGTPCTTCPNGYSCSNNLCIEDSDGNDSDTNTGKSDEDCFTGDGSDYQGTASTTVSGKTCLNWSDVYSFLPGNNYCRNYFAAYGFTEPVCYMQTGTHYIESCGVPKCGKK
ncbi:GLIPR1-like protein 1 [Ostrea edulis]|uniref:GLIPR1-like protein 1 n=1 Tax=Ostrea edulis TaxID=37623 RepID=UPI0024AF3CEC|nr:GLIPR1-like protein 1 [Ostrea edulis]